LVPSIFCSSSFFFFFFFFETRSLNIAEASLECMTLLPLLSECWDYKHAPLHQPGSIHLFFPCRSSRATLFCLKLSKEQSMKEHAWANLASFYF
jgi:hypothetical protein